MELWFRIAACLDGMRPLPNAEATSLRARVWRHLSFLALLTMAACVPSFGMHHNNALRHAHRSRRHLRRIAWSCRALPTTTNWNNSRLAKIWC